MNADGSLSEDNIKFVLLQVIENFLSKSSLINLLPGMIRRTSGRVIIDGLGYCLQQD